MSKSKEKYFYSKEEDDVIVRFVKDDFLKRQKERKSIERNWELNLNFYVGNQYSYISSTGDISDIEKNFRWENREVYNHIAPIIECRLAKLNKIKPNLTIRPASSSDDDEASALVARNILNSALDKNSMEKLVLLATAWSEITGTSFYKITWNNNFGNIIGISDGKSIKNGDVEISVCSPFEIFPDSNSAIEIDDCESIIEARAVSVKRINSEYKLNLSGEDIDIYEIGNNSFLSNIAGRSNIPKIIHDKKHDNVLVIERYEKPSIEKPKGRFTVICKDKLLYDGELPYEGLEGKRIYPFVKQVSTKQITSFWGTSVIERCIPLQKAYNSIKNKKHEYISRLASGVLTVEDGSVDVDNLEEEGLAPGKILIYRNGSTPPSFLPVSNIPVELEKEEASLLAEMNSLACVSDVTINSNVPSSVTSGSALEILIEQDESRLSLVGENIRIAIKNIGEHVIRLYKQYATGTRISKIANCKGSTDILYWTNNDLTCDDVVFETINEFEESSSKQKELILKLYEKGLFSDENGEINQATKKNLLEMLGIKNYKEKQSIDEINSNNANFENLDIENLSDPIELDDHEIHIFEHTKFLLTNQKIKQNGKLKNKLITHINNHKKYIKSEE